MASNTIIPSIDARGRFEAEAPFDLVVKPEVYYTVEAIRNIHEMEALKLDLFELVFKPAGFTADTFPAALERARKDGAKVLSLLDRADVATYVLTNYLKSWPLVDGVSYEHMVIIADMGPVPPGMADILAKEIAHIKDHIEANVGITTTVTIGTIPTIGYVSKEQADAYENVRKSKITDSGNDVARIRELEAQAIRDHAYIQQLEAALAARP
ncbi:hypothetical protein D3C79_48490 [compost metagenome]